MLEIPVVWKGQNELSNRFRDQEVAGSNPVSPTFFRNDPFGKNVEPET
jgi:hypothetical protein